MNHQPETYFVGIWIIFMIFMWLGLVVFIVGGLILQIWMLIDCVANENNDQNQRVLWTLLIVFLQGIGALIYLLVRRPKRKAELGR